MDTEGENTAAVLVALIGVALIAVFLLVMVVTTVSDTETRPTPGITQHTEGTP